MFRVFCILDAHRQPIQSHLPRHSTSEDVTDCTRKNKSTIRYAHNALVFGDYDDTLHPAHLQSPRRMRSVAGERSASIMVPFIRSSLPDHATRNTPCSQYGRPYTTSPRCSMLNPVTASGHDVPSIRSTYSTPEICQVKFVRNEPSSSSTSTGLPPRNFTAQPHS
ncbi:hypothetical protein BJX68DRAFT_77006 [Aspergillus pseudodeflectus]|uniref:Uncharacterized protein n=1 Tax=Aspergillus pseudodeflectus TaxID=176178 RepID=A0ABR4KI71_9EURO